MLKPGAPKSGFVIKLSEETAQKLAEDEQKSKTNDVRKVTDSVETAKELSSEPSQEISSRNEKVKHCPTEPRVVENFETAATTSAPVNNEKKSNAEIVECVDYDEKSNVEIAPYLSYEGNEVIYTNPTSLKQYSWNAKNKRWDIRSGDPLGRVYSYEGDTRIYTDPDGSKFFWDVDKNAWIPKVDDEFLAYYQMSYGFVDNKVEEKKDDKDTNKEDGDSTNKEDKVVNKKPDTVTTKRKNEPQWFEQSDEKNTKVYVSNLPLDLNEEEFVDLMQKYGLIERDPSSQKMKVKLYMDKEVNCFKGDALCTYIKVESVELALKLLDGSNYKGNTIKVEKAHFQQKGAYNPALKPKKKKKKELEKIKKMQQKLFDWRPEKFIGERAKHERVVIVKNLFLPSDFDNEVGLILDYQQDLREECTKCGEVRRVVLYDRHPEGVAQITMKEPEQADAVVQLINGRWFGKRQITAEIWDGRTKYRIAETDADINKRIDKWDKFLEGKEKGDENKETDSTSNPTSEKGGGEMQEMNSS